MARRCPLQVLFLLVLISLCAGEPYLRRLATGDGNDSSNGSNETGCVESNDSNSTVNCSGSQSAVGGQSGSTTTTTTTEPTTTTTTTTTMTRAAAAVSDDSPTIIIIVVVCSLLALGAGGLCVYGVITYLQSAELENRKLVKQVDSDATGFEQHLNGVANNVQRFNHRLAQDKALKEQYEKEVAAFAKDWQKVEDDSKDFLVKQYTPCLRERQEVQQAKDMKRRMAQQKRREAAERKVKAALDRQIRQKRKELDLEEKKRVKEGQPPRTPEELNALATEAARVGQEESGRASLMIGASSANLVPDEEVGCLPRGSVTSNRELRKQLKRLGELQNLHANSISQLKQLRDQIWPTGGSGLEDLDLPVPTEAPKPSGGWWSGGGGGGRNQYLDVQVSVIKTFTHPLLNKIEVKPYSVLGTTDKENKELAPFSPLEAVIVDPAGYSFIGYRNSCRGAGAASGSIYKWLNLNAPPANGRFPPEVNRHFSASREAEAEGRAKFFAYNQGQVVIHTVGPKLRELLPGVQCLSRTYLSVLTEYCQALLKEESQKATASETKSESIQASPSKGSGKGRRELRVPRVLRLCPISSGIFCEDARLQPHMADITWAAVSLALAMLPAELQELLSKTQLEMCVFQTREFPVYQGALAVRKGFVSGPPKFDTDRGRVASRSGYDWVRKQNSPQDRLERLAAFMLTAQATAAGGYALSGPTQLLTIKPMLEGTRLYRAPAKEEPATAGANPEVQPADDATQANPEVPAPVSVPQITFDQDGLTVIEAAVKVAKANRAAVGVNAASAYSVGGGVLSGGRHALEESCCITSTLLASLQKAQWDQLHSPEEKKPASEKGGHWQQEEEGPHAHVPVDGCIVSPYVEVFREGSNNGYGFFETPVRLQGFCSVAMFNMNPRVSDSPLDAPREFKAYCHQVKQKFRAVVNSAAQLGAEVLVCPDVGCGVFGNDPQVLGTLFGEVLREPPPDGAIKEVLLTGQVAFAEAVRRAAAGEKVELTPPAYFATAYGAVDGYVPSGGGGRQNSRGRPQRGGPERPGPTVVVATVASPTPNTRPGGVAPVSAQPQPAAAQPVGAQAQPIGGVSPAAAQPAGGPSPAPAAAAAGAPVAAAPAVAVGAEKPNPAVAPSGAEAAAKPAEAPAGAGAGGAGAVM